jgi:hypothetical protein
VLKSLVSSKRSKAVPKKLIYFLSVPRLKMKSYVPPSKRHAKVEKVINLKDEKEFPTFGTVSNKKWEGKSFKNTIDDLIALDKQTLAQRKAIQEAQEAKQGWTTIVLPKTASEFKKISERLYECEKESKRIQELKDLGLYAEPVEYVNINTLYMFEDDYSESEFVDESED